jgi:hypothetical protein
LDNACAALYCAGTGSDLVADTKWFGQQDQDASQEVLEDVLECKANGNAGDAECADEVGRRERRKRDRNGQQRPEQNDARLGDAAEHEDQVLVVPPGAGALHQLAADAGGEQEREQHQDGNADVRQHPQTLGAQLLQQAVVDDGEVRCHGCMARAMLLAS